MKRRDFIKTVAASAGLVYAATKSLNFLEEPATAKTNLFWLRHPHRKLNLLEATIPEIQAALQFRLITSKELVQLYLNRIEAYDQRGPNINAIRDINPNALQIAEDLDRERAFRGPRGLLFGIPILLKDNIDTADEPTTAGSLALQGSIPPDDAFITNKLRDQGAIILGKANLTEFANFVSSHMPSGYSSLGGQVLNPYNPGQLEVGGSSAGSGAAVAASLITVAIGTETDGSILNPSNQNSLVGIKPTVGLVSRDGIIPIAHSQDTAGPMARSVTDAAILLGAITGVEPSDPATNASKGKFYTDYTQFLDPNGLKGARIGIPRFYYQFLSPEEDSLVEAAIKKIGSLEAEIIDSTPIATAQELESDGIDVLIYEFKHDLNAYLASLGPNAPVHSLKDIIAFNNAHPEQALKYGQDILEQSEATSGTLTEAQYFQARATDLLLAKTNGIDAVMAQFQLDALLFPEDYGADIGARAGYPSVIVPAGYTKSGSPVGITFLGTAFSEPTLIKFAYAYEQATRLRRPPASTPPLPKDIIPF